MLGTAFGSDGVFGNHTMRWASLRGSVLKNASVVSDVPHSKKAGRFGTSCGARPIEH